MQKSFNKLLVNSLVTLITFTYFTYLSKADTFVYSGGCFWCTEADTEKLDGVSDVISGFTAGTTKDPKYIPRNIFWVLCCACSETTYNI